MRSATGGKGCIRCGRESKGEWYGPGKGGRGGEG